MTDRIYLDWNATAPLRPQARAAAMAAFDALWTEVAYRARARHEPARNAVAT